ncbi:MAG: 4Fe-4S binding protein [Anaerolineae bacterium]|nr:4Fe-4S binding protein [Anaerolineae bacterium]
MRITTILGDMLRALVRRPMTQAYPAVRRDAPSRLRGRLLWNPEKCTGCCLCVKDCPADAIEMITLDKAAKRFVLRYHVDRCAFCAQCVQNCRFKCLSMSSDQWELAAKDRAPFTVYYGSEEDVHALLEKFAARADQTLPAAES